MIATADDGKAVAAIERLIGLKLPRLDIQGLETGSISDNHEGARRRKRVQSTARTKTKPERVTPPADGSSRGRTRKKTDGGNVPTPANGSQSRKQSSRKRAERDDGKRSKGGRQSARQE